MKTKKLITNIIISAILVGSQAFLTGCDNDAGTGALIGAAIGAGVGQAAGGDTKSTAIGAGVGAGAGYIIGNQSDKSKEKQSTAQAQPVSEETVWVTNSNGSQTPVVLRRDGDKYIGPKGEIYSKRPTDEQLKQAYGF